MKHFLIPIAAVIILAFSTASIVRSQPKRQATQPPIDPPQSVFVNRVAAVGLVEANTENISLSAPLPGVVERVLVKVGQDVKAGDPLVQLDVRSLESTQAERRAERLARGAAVVAAKARVDRARASMSEAQRLLGFVEAVNDSRSISLEETTRRRSHVETTSADVKVAEAEVLSAQAAVELVEASLRSVETDLSRSLITAPITGRILQVRIRPGEYATAGSSTPWMILGNVSPLHVRVDVDENEAWRVKPDARATAQVRGNARLSMPLAFVRFEPYVIPKLSLTGSSQERVDTRVLQVIYQVLGTDVSLFVGQQLDVFIEANEVQTAQAQP